MSGGAESESERSLAVGGAGAVPTEVFDGFAYVALGHLHRPQYVGREEIRYSGSLLPYSFSEVDSAAGLDVRKSVTLADLRPDGSVEVEAHFLEARRPMRIVHGLLDTLIDTAKDDPSRDDYLLVRLDDPRPRLDVMARLREEYPNVLHVERMVLDPGEVATKRRRDHRGLSPFDLFVDFFSEITGASLDAEQQAVVSAVVEAEERAALGRQTVGGAA